VEAIYHRQVMQRALGGRVSRRALAAMLRANLGQDSLAGLIRPAFHFDNSLFEVTLAYIDGNRQIAAQTSNSARAWLAFGRLSHAVQDFYSHSNYVALWLERQPADQPAPVTAIDGLDPALLRHRRLKSGRVYFPLEALWLLKPLRPMVKRLVPRDAHAWMNIDSPQASHLFPYAIEAAVQRTIDEYDLTVTAIRRFGGEIAVRLFNDI
jgi:hypothetical protein